jgi:predicted NBD/HSP70 family sugar kinase
MALALVSVASLFDPKLIVLGGSVGGRSELVARICDEIRKCSARPIEVRASTLGTRAGVVGAVAVALNRLYDELFGLSDLPGALSLPSSGACKGVGA